MGSRIIRERDGSYAAEFDIRTVQQQLADAANEQRFLQSYASGTYSVLPEIEPAPTTAVFELGAVLTVRTAERVAALGHLLGALPDVEWLRHEVLGATMIVHARLRGEVSRSAVVANVTRALASD